MAPLLLELSSLEVEPLQIVEHAPGREGFYTPLGFDTPEQESSLETLTTALHAAGIDAIWTGHVQAKSNCCCCI